MGQDRERCDRCQGDPAEHTTDDTPFWAVFAVSRVIAASTGSSIAPFPGTVYAGAG